MTYNGSAGTARPHEEMEPSLCELEQMRLFGRGGSPASKFHEHYGVSPVFVFFTRVSAHATQCPPLSQTLAMRSGNLEKDRMRPHSSGRR